MERYEEPYVLGSAVGPTVRTGPWRVHARSWLRARFGASVLDLSEAELLVPHVVVTVDLLAGTLEVVAPPDLHVASDLRVLGATYDDERASDPGPDAERSLTLRGRAMWGSVVVRSTLTSA